LTQAILAKTFRGDLVSTEAELARREGRDYEPASVLIERIRRDRLATGKRPGKHIAAAKPEPQSLVRAEHAPRSRRVLSRSHPRRRKRGRAPR
jgi:hypothetical protein